LGPGIAAALAAFLLFNYFFIQPYFSLVVHQTQDLVGLVVFLSVAVVISQLLGRARAQPAGGDLARAGDAAAVGADQPAGEPAR
jgi:two-component system sensor histidine kinase KdpD